ncbi:peptidase [Rossellomorea aquimaris]|uniref:Probable succinyl-diaminopimelate desuccinylase n=1 Tax=Rossellomorea aquimaris TaxID=189382 RepID=A0A5D4TT97_9BACI|nr:peptidase [Rossellomorea aquimaris]TYS77306.1 peptidase [Rossellomorea aquimaris]TYS86484.1 peptidase [Rossellomorea aquimaris]
METHRLIKKIIEEKKKSTIKLLQRLVQEDSVRGNESKAQAIVIEKCRKLGLELDIWEVKESDVLDHPFYRCDRENFEGNPNVVGVLKGTGGGRSLLLNGHIDVVPEGDRENWTYDPYGGVIEEGKLYGRGSTDMKGGSVALLLALEIVKELNIPLKGDILFQSVIEEESGGTGTLAALVRGYKADAAIIPEPTNMKIFPKQQGSMWFRLKVRGKSAHGGTRYEGVNAIDKAYTVIQTLQELELSRNKRVDDPLYRNIPIPLPINIGRIESGKWPSSVPDLAIIEGRVGVGPWESLQQVEKEVEDALSKMDKVDSWFDRHPVEIEWFGGRWQPGDLSCEHELVEKLSYHANEVLETTPIIEASPWGTDGGILSRGGNIPVVVFGPGTTEVAHDANEYIELNKIYQTAEILSLFILDWCNKES